MNANQYIPVGVLVNSCLIGANAYRVLTSEEEFQEAWLEEITDTIRQRPGYRYMRARIELDKQELWLVPFYSTEEPLLLLQDTIEYVQGNCLGKRRLHFPFDIVEENNYTAMVILPWDRAATVPIRHYLPKADAPRWQLAKSLFHRLGELHAMGLTSNGISREQLRVDAENQEVELHLNHTLRLINATGKDLHHEGFCTVPVKTETTCTECGKQVTGVQRDIFSAAILTFYLLMYTHPFLGHSFNPLSREDYLPRYLHAPDYIMDPDGSNSLSNQLFDREVEYQWGVTVPELKTLFDGIFLAASHPEQKWNPKDPWWDIQNWIAAIDADARANDKESSRSRYKFGNYLYHLV